MVLNLYIAGLINDIMMALIYFLLFLFCSAEKKMQCKHFKLGGRGAAVVSANRNPGGLGAAN